MRRNKRRVNAGKGPTVEQSAADPIARAIEMIRYLQARLTNPDDLLGRDEVRRHLATIEDELKSTHESSDSMREDYLVSESSSVTRKTARRATQTADRSKDSPRDVNNHLAAFRSDRGLVLKTLPQVGRASVTRRRARYFEGQPEVTDEEQADRSIRSNEANARAAARIAADHAIAADCGLWITMTFADPIQEQDAVTAIFGFLDRLARKYRRSQRKPFHYVAIVDVSQSRPHLHGLLTRDVETQMIHDLWRYGSIQTIEEIPRDQIERKVNYMKDRVRFNRATKNRFLRSRGLVSDQLLTEVTDFEEARDVLNEQIAPRTARIVSAQPFGGSPRLVFRFDPIDADIRHDPTVE